MRLLNALILSLSFGLVQCSILLPRDDPLQQLSLSSDADSYKIPSVHESAIMARRILRLESIGTTSTVFPHDTSNLHGAPAGIEGQPIGLMEYFADCETSTGNPTLLAVAIATSFKNVAAGSNITLSVRYHAPKSARMTPAALPRFSLMGHLEDIRDVDVEKGDITKCYRTYHPDAFWTPGNDVHESRWVRLVVDKVFWFGGFGDRAYIGWIPVDVWKNVTEKEIGEYRLPGEEKKALSWAW